MKIAVHTWLCDKHANELAIKLSDKKFRLFVYGGVIPCQEKRCDATATYKVHLWTEIRGRKA